MTNPQEILDALLSFREATEMGFQSMDKRFDALESRFDNLIRRLDLLENRIARS